jgi:Flp pilus assembly protein TadG
MMTPGGAGVRRTAERGQILVIAVLAMIAMIGGVALILEGGNAYAHQRMSQNAADSAANAGATVLAERLGGATLTDANVKASVGAMATANGLTSNTAYYTDIVGQLLTPAGLVTSDPTAAAKVGGLLIPPGARGVRDAGTQSFGTTFGRVIGFNQFSASADATAVAGILTGGQFLPVVFPVNIVDCSQNGDLGIGDTSWVLSQPPSGAQTYPNGPEYIIPLCKTGGGSFMVLDLDGIRNNCADEVTNPPAIQFPDFPVDVASDNGNNCAKPMVDAVNALHGKVVLVPICDASCTTSGGSHATYHIIKVAALWLDYMSDSNNKNSLCQTHINPLTGLQVTTIRGNGSSSCIAGWFVRYITAGPVGPGNVTGSSAVGIQLIR